MSRRVTVKRTVYKFDELAAWAQTAAINNEVGCAAMFAGSDGYVDPEYVKKAVAECERLRIPWFLNEYIWEYGKDSILADLKENEFFENGTIYYPDRT
jgi:hypothetical protein